MFDNGYILSVGDKTCSSPCQRRGTDALQARGSLPVSPSAGLHPHRYDRYKHFHRYDSHGSQPGAGRSVGLTHAPGLLPTSTSLPGKLEHTAPTLGSGACVPQARLQGRVLHTSPSALSFVGSLPWVADFWSHLDPEILLQGNRHCKSSWPTQQEESLESVQLEERLFSWMPTFQPISKSMFFSNRSQLQNKNLYSKPRLIN